MLRDYVATEVGQKIEITSGKNTYYKSKAFDGLYSEGSVLTVKRFSDIKHKYTGGYHIAEVEEFETPEGEEVAIFIGEYKIVSV